MLKFKSRRWADGYCIGHLGVDDKGENILIALEAPGHAPSGSPMSLVITAGVPLFNELWKPQYSTPLHDRPGLFRTFASIPPTPKRILGFANRYGLLGIGRTVAVPEDSEICSVESLIDWQRAILRMYWAIMLWDLIKAKDAKTLADIVSVRPDGEVRFSPGSRGPACLVHVKLFELEVLEVQLLVTEEFRRLKVKDPASVLPRLVIKKLINEGLRAQVSALMVLHQRKLQLDHEPTTLLAGLWYQLAHFIHSGKDPRVDLRHCLHCGGWLAHSPKTCRSNRRYCDDTCKDAARKWRQQLGQVRRRKRRGRRRAPTTDADRAPKTVKGMHAALPSV